MRRPMLLGIILGALGLCLVCLVVLCVVVVVLQPGWLPFGAHDRILVASPSRNGEADLYLVRLGDDLSHGTTLAEDTGAGSGSLSALHDGQVGTIGTFGYGGFLRGTSYLLYQYQEEGETSVYRLRIGGREPSLVFQSRAAYSLWTTDGQTLFIHEYRSEGQMRCHVSRNGAEAERVARGSECRFSLDGSTVVYTDPSPDGLTLTAIGSDGSREITLLDQAEQIESFRLSSDGSRLAYVQGSDAGTSRVVVVNRDDGSLVAEGEELYSLLTYAFAPQGTHLYYIGENEEGDLILSTLDAEARLVATGDALDAAFTSSGDYLVYLVAGEAGEETVFVHPMAGGEDVELVSGRGLSYSILPSPERILITLRDQDELTLYSAQAGVQGLTELFSDDDLRGFEARAVFGEPTLYLTLVDGSGQSSLFVTPIDSASGVLALEGWDSIRLLNRSADGRHLLFAGREDRVDAETLYSLEVAQDASPVELDDDTSGVLNAVYARGGREVLYTASTDSAADDVEVRLVPTDGQRPFEVVFEESYLADIEWDDLFPFPSEAIDFRAAQVAGTFCPGALRIMVGDALEADLAQGARDCYRLRVSTPGDYSVSVDSANESDTRLEVHDRDGNFLASDDDSGPGLNPHLHMTFEQSGLYYIMVLPYGSDDSGPYTIAVTEGIADTILSAAQLLSANETERGTITAESELYFEQFDETIYGALYYFDARANDYITIDVAAGSIGSSFQPATVLLDASLQPLTYASPATGGQDVRLNYLVTSDARYYVLVGSMTEEYGTAADYFYEITLTRGAPPPRGGGPISFGETRDAYIYGSDADRWTFSGGAGDYVSITMTSSSIDSTLELLGPDGSSAAYNDDGLGYPNAMVNAYLPDSGTYTILARSLTGSAGQYTISLSLSEPGGGTITFGQTVSGNLVIGGQDRWEFTTSSPNSVMIEMTSEVFDTYLELLAPDGSMLTYNDDAESTRVSRIDYYHLSSAGTYTIVARSYANASGGAYELSLYAVEVPATETPRPTEAPYPTGAGGGISIGQTINGYLILGARDEWSFYGTAGTRVTITMTSSDIDSFLELWSPGGSILTDDDDGAGFPNAQIASYRLPTTGTYIIVARAYGNHGEGPYTLTLQ